MFFPEPRITLATFNIKYRIGNIPRVRGIPLETLNSMAGDVEESEEGREKEQDVEDPGHHGDEVVGDHKDNALEGLEAAVEGDDEDDVADADAEQGDEGRGPEEVGVLVDEDPRRQGEARVQLGGGLTGEYGDEQDDHHARLMATTTDRYQDCRRPRLATGLKLLMSMRSMR